MANTLVESQLREVKAFLKDSNKRIEHFLNETTLSALVQGDEDKSSYYQTILSQFRKLLVYSEESLDTCAVLLQGTPFQKSAAERTLYRIYHQCIDEFFSPKNGAWYEDSRSAYTGRNSIKFHKPVPDSVSSVLRGLEAGFQQMREDLEYYETDYRTKMMQSK
jgi:Protein of unknown function (DUF3907)